MIALLLSAALAAPLSPDQVVAAALAHDPAVVAAEGAVFAARGARAEARLLRENPEIDVAISTDGSLLDLGLSQPLSLTGQGLAEARAARAELEAAEARAERARLVAAAEARIAWAQAAEARARRELAEAALAALSRHRDAVEARVSEGNSAGLDLRLARLDEAAAAGEVLAARQNEREALAALAALTGEPEAEAMGDPLLAAPATWTPGDRADLRAADAQVEAATARVSAERAATLPALAVGAFVEQDDGVSRAGPTLSVEIPLWRWNADGRAEATAAADLARAERASLAARASVEQKRASDEDLLPHLEAPAADALAVLDAVDAAWQAGALDALDASLLRARALDAQRAALDARAALAEARISAALAAGSPDLLPASP